MDYDSRLSGLPRDDPGPASSTPAQGVEVRFVARLGVSDLHGADRANFAASRLLY
jgi:hypothetical protein